MILSRDIVQDLHQFVGLDLGEKMIPTIHIQPINIAIILSAFAFLNQKELP